jgi:hypothetical protein
MASIVLEPSVTKVFVRVAGKLEKAEAKCLELFTRPLALLWVKFLPLRLGFLLQFQRLYARNSPGCPHIDRCACWSFGRGIAKVYNCGPPCSSMPSKPTLYRNSAACAKPEMMYWILERLLGEVFAYDLPRMKPNFVVSVDAFRTRNDAYCLQLHMASG